MKRGRLSVVVALVGVNLVILAYAGYGLYTRAGSPRFSKGGDFGGYGAPTSAPSAPTRNAPSAPAGSLTDAPSRPDEPGPDARGSHVARATDREALGFPSSGTYEYASHGREEIRYGFASACSWELDGSSAAVKRDGSRAIVDWTYSDNRQERHIDDYRRGGIYTEFVGAAVTCAGMRHTSEGTYDPPAMRIPWPLAVGATWTVDARTEERRERGSGRVLARRTVGVPAGAYESYQIRVSFRLSGSEEGTFDSTFWFSPELGLPVKQRSETDVRRGDARFTSDFTITLTRAP